VGVGVPKAREVARAAVLAGGEVVRSAGEDEVEGRARAKGLPGDWVTEVDLAAEQAIRQMLERETPDVPVLGEETGGATEGRRWVVDPLDGTTNFIHRFPAVGVSVALVDGVSVIAGAVHAPFLGQTWHAGGGEGGVWEPEEGRARVLEVSSRPVERAIVGTGFPFRRKEQLPRYLRAMERALEVFEDLRRPGAASLDLAWVASGVFDGFFELGLGTWDVAAGGLLIQEAGGTVVDWTGFGDGWLGGDILAGPPVIVEELLKLARAAEG
jgi:myo-inositol-1(or 4)-monophosphatase